MGKMPGAFLVIVLAGLSLVNAQTPPPANPSFGSIPEEHHVPAAGFSSRELQGRITSWAVSKDDEPSLFAWYDDDGSGGLHEPLHVIRYTRERGLQRTDIRGNTDKIEDCRTNAQSPRLPQDALR
jgi:hypothetical protein